MKFLYIKVIVEYCIKNINNFIINIERWVVDINVDFSIYFDRE